MNNKKGNLADIFYIAAVLFGAILSIIIVYHIWTSMSPEIDSAMRSAVAINESSVNITATLNNVGYGIVTFNSIISLFFVGLLIMAVISAFMIESHPVFFFISILLLVIAVLVSVVFANIYQQITETDELSSAASNFTVPNLIMEYLPYIIVIVAVIIMIALFVKPSFLRGTEGSV